MTNRNPCLSGSETISAMDGLLVLKECPGCDYSLVGLPYEGTCPECGRPYEQGTAILNGWARGKKANLVTAPPRILIGMAIVWLCCITPILFTTGGFGFRSVPSPEVLCGIMAFSGFAIPFLQRMQRSSARPPIRARLNAAGCSQTVSLRRNDLSDPFQIVLGLIPAALSIAYLIITIVQGRNILFAVVITGIILVVVLVQWLITLRKRRRLTHVPLAAALTPDDAATTPPTLWKEVSDVRLTPAGRGRCRLRVCDGSWWNRTEPVDIEIDADAEQVEKLLKQINEWRAAATRAQPIAPNVA